MSCCCSVRQNVATGVISLNKARSLPMLLSLRFISICLCAATVCSSCVSLSEEGGRRMIGYADGMDGATNTLMRNVCRVADGEVRPAVAADVRDLRWKLISNSLHVLRFKSVGPELHGMGFSERVTPSAAVIATLSTAFPEDKADMNDTGYLKADYTQPTVCMGLKQEEIWVLHNKKTGTYF